MRVKTGSIKQARNGAYIHVLVERPRFLKPEFEFTEAQRAKPERAGAEHCDLVYRALLDQLHLLPRHSDHLKSERHLSEETINRNQYRSVPISYWGLKYCQALSAQFNLSYVPGFWKRSGGSWRLNVWGSGILIPIRDEHKRILALQIRREQADPTGKRYFWLSSTDKPLGGSSGAPTHFRNTHKIEETGEAIITEGALKADIIAEHTGEAVIAISSVNTFSDSFGEELRERLPSLERVIIAFDSDFRTNQAVKGGLVRLKRSLRNPKADFTVAIRQWPPQFKGYDNFLIHGAQQL